MITYSSSLDTLQESMLTGFFVGWPNPPSGVSLMRVFKGSYVVWTAVDDSAQKVVGFITCISDGVISAYIPLLEVLPEYQKMGIGKELVQRMLQSLSGLYMVDLLCDENLQGYYEKLGMYKANGMMIRNPGCLIE